MPVMTMCSPLEWLPRRSCDRGLEAELREARGIFCRARNICKRLKSRPTSAYTGGARRCFGCVSGLLLIAVNFGFPFGIPSAAADPKGPVLSLREMRTQGVVLQKSDLSCGAAALATLLNYQFGDQVTEREVTEGLIRRQEYIEQPELVRIREGFSLLDMKRYVTNRGYTGIGYGKLEFDDLIPLAPLIVAVSPLGYNHFVVFRGTIGDKVLLADSTFGNRTMTREKFERIWIDFPQIGKVGFIISRNDKPAPPGKLSPHVSQFVAPPDDFVRQLLRF